MNPLEASTLQTHPDVPLPSHVTRQHHCHFRGGRSIVATRMFTRGGLVSINDQIAASMRGSIGDGPLKTRYQVVFPVQHVLKLADNVWLDRRNGSATKISLSESVSHKVNLQKFRGFCTVWQDWTYAMIHLPLHRKGGHVSRQTHLSLASK